MPKYLLLATVLIMTACHHDHDAAGPAERAGHGVDTAAQKTGEALEGAAQKTGDAVTRATKATGRAFERAGNKLSGDGETREQEKPAPELKPPADDK